MSLSSSTLSLKFMQRGLARSAPSPSPRTQQQVQPSTPSTISAPAASSTPAAGPSRSTPHSTVITRGDPLVTGETPLSRTEEEARWFMPKRSSGSGTSTSGATRNGPTVSFEQSYLPFLVKSPTLDEDDEDYPVASATGGGGRMTFGATTNPESDEEDEHGSNDGEDVDMEEDVTDTRQRRGSEKTKTRASSPPHPTPSRAKDRTFQRPALSPPPQLSSSTPSSSRPKPKSQSSNNQPHASIADKMRQTISARSGAFPASSAPVATAVAESERNTPSFPTASKHIEGEPMPKKSKKKRAASSDAHVQRPSIANLSSSEATASSSFKRPKISPSTIPSATPAQSQNTPQSKKNKNKKSQAPTLDEREAQLKAAKKAEKRSKAKAKA